MPSDDDRRDDDRRYDPTAERFFPKGDFPQPDPHLGEGDVAPSWYDTPPQDGRDTPLRDGRDTPRRRDRGSPPPDERGAARDPEPGAGGDQGRAGSEPQGTAEGAAGPELARAVLDAALAKRRAAASNPRRRDGGGTTGKRPRGYSGPGPDPRDPQLFGDVLNRLMRARGWEKPKAEAMVFGAWEKVVGPDIAKHSRPVKLDGGVLTVEAESTAWATQLRMLAATLLRSIAGEVGHNVVTKLNIHGPAAPSWSKGPRRVQGRGPRDTYG